MVKKKSWFNSFISLLLTVVMLFSVLPTTLVSAAEIGDANQGNNGTNGGTAWNGSVTWSEEEFIRVSIWFAEMDETGKVDWSNNNFVRQVGTTIDLRSPVYQNLNGGSPVIYGNYTDGNNTARGYINKKKIIQGSSWTQMVMPKMSPGKTQEEAKSNAKTMEFPILFTPAKNGVNAKDYFMSYSVYNELLWATQSRAYPEGARDNVPWQGVDNMKKGIYKDEFGVDHYGQYMILLEPGLFCKIGGQKAALTLRDMMVMHSAGHPILRNLVDPSRNLANSLYTELNWSMFGLKANGVKRISGRVRENTGVCWESLGVGVIQFDIAQKQQLPVINYYYNLNSTEIEDSNVDRTDMSKKLLR